MNWKHIYGREQTTSALRTALAEGRIAHAYLFCGPDGIGKKLLAKVLSAALICERGMDEACEICPACLKVKVGSHPDLHWIAPDGKSLKIAQIREVKNMAYLKPREGRFQVFVLERAETMTPEAGNSLLKVLEEPPPATVFILLADSPTGLLPTVVSRSQLYPLLRLGTDALTRILQEARISLSPAECERIVAAAEGIPGRALGLAREGEHRQYTEAVTLLTELLKKGDVATLADSVSENTALPLLLDALVTVLRDILVLQATGNQCLLTPGSDIAAMYRLLLGNSTSQLMGAVKTVLQLQKDLESPVNVRLALETALRRLKEGITDADCCRYSI